MKSAGMWMVVAALAGLTVAGCEDDRAAAGEMSPEERLEQQADQVEERGSEQADQLEQAADQKVEQMNQGADKMQEQAEQRADQIEKSAEQQAEQLRDRADQVDDSRNDQKNTADKPMLGSDADDAAENRRTNRNLGAGNRDIDTDTDRTVGARDTARDTTKRSVSTDERYNEDNRADLNKRRVQKSTGDAMERTGNKIEKAGSDLEDPKDND